MIDTDTAFIFVKARNLLPETRAFRKVTLHLTGVVPDYVETLSTVQTQFNDHSIKFYPNNFPIP